MNLSINEIKENLSGTPIDKIVETINLYKNDERKGVQNLIKSYSKKYDNYLNELKRIEDLTAYEKKYYSDGKLYIAGIDEVGRGPLAGPVVTAAVILPKECRILGINDSKKLSAKTRAELFLKIKENALAIGIGIVPSTVIDDINILQATYKAMQQAIQKLNITPEQILVDAVTIPNIEIPQEPIIKGDAKSISIGAASIIAKVTRDEMMVKYSEIYPEYHFEQNKGYGSEEHINAIKKYGLCPIHRRSFTHNFV